MASSQLDSPPADSLVAAGLQAQVLYPADAEYDKRIESYWCNSAKLRPACIFQPRSAGDVAKTVAALAKAGQPFAVRSGGHTNWAGSNNIAGGVTIDLAHLNAIDYDAAAQTVSVWPAATWKELYDTVAKYGRVVVGGRAGEVGVGGLLLGGGNTFYTARHGLACDNVVAYEVVLADGRVVTADAAGPYADLFLVLKGGGNNFGIVTRFVLRTLPRTPLWGGLLVMPTTALAVAGGAAKALVDFAANVHKYPDSSVVFVTGHLPPLGGDVAIAICVDVAGNERPPAFSRFLALPAMFDTLKITDIQEVLAYSTLPPDYYNIWFTLTVKNDVSIINKAIELHADLAKKLKGQIPDGDFRSHCAFQPIPKLFAAASAAAGGNILGLERHAHDGVMLQASASVRTAAQAEWALLHVRGVIEGVRAFAQGVDGGDGGGVLPWLHLNYAHGSQEVLQSYGEENVRKMREAAAKYDPTGVFQRLCPGGFKLAAVKD